MRLAAEPKNTKPYPDLDVSAEMMASMELGIRSITWDMVKQELLKDKTYSDLSSWITSRCKGPTEDLPPHIKPYWKLRNNLHCVEYVPMFNDRTIIPTGMRQQVLEVLHSAHQGVYSMGLRAEESVFWPNLWKDLEIVRLACNTFNKIATSQSNLPPVEPVVPEYPFQHVCIDYLTLKGVSYGVFADCYTGWPGVISGTLASDVATFITRLCEYYG